MTSIKQIIQNPAGLVADVKSKISGAAAGAEDFIRANPATSAATLAGTAAAGLTAVQIIRKKKTKSSTSKKSTTKSKKKTSKKKKKNYQGHTKRGWKQDRARRSKEKHEVAYQRRKSGKKTKKKTGKVYYTKNGQPYKILASGKAKFIKGRRKK